MLEKIFRTLELYSCFVIMNTVIKTVILLPDLIIVLIFLLVRRPLFRAFNLIYRPSRRSNEYFSPRFNDYGPLVFRRRFFDFFAKHNVLSGTLAIHSKIAERLKSAEETFALHILPKSCLNFEDQYLVFATICYPEKLPLELQIPKLRD